MLNSFRLYAAILYGHDSHVNRTLRQYSHNERYNPERRTATLQLGLGPQCGGGKIDTAFPENSWIRKPGEGRIFLSCVSPVVFESSRRDVLIRLLRRVIPLEVISHRKVRLKLLITAVELLLQCSAEDDRDIR